jgi:hypothetical protein
LTPHLIVPVDHILDPVKWKKNCDFPEEAGLIHRFGQESKEVANALPMIAVLQSSVKIYSRKLERMRCHLGFKYTWNPAADRFSQAGNGA